MFLFASRFSAGHYFLFSGPLPVGSPVVYDGEEVTNTPSIHQSVPVSLSSVRCYACEFVDVGREVIVQSTGIHELDVLVKVLRRAEMQIVDGDSLVISVQVFPVTKDSILGVITHEVMDGSQSIDDIFTQCDSCGRYLIDLSGHTCPSETESPSRLSMADRAELADSDPRPSYELVLILPAKAPGSNGHSYHEISDDGTPVCGGPGPARTEYVAVTRREAKDRDRAPCRSCEKFTQ